MEPNQKGQPPIYDRRLRAHVASVTAQVIATATQTPINFTTPIFDNGQFWHPNVPSRLTIRRRGIYQFGGGFQWDVGGAGTYRYAFLQWTSPSRGTVSSGLTNPGANGFTPSGAAGLANRHPPIVSPWIELFPADYCEIIALQDSGANRNFDNGNLWICALDIY